jgi:hypothetical protein
MNQICGLRRYYALVGGRRQADAGDLPRSRPAGSNDVQHRVLFDFEITFSNGGDLRGRDFRLDIPGASVEEAALARHVVDDLRLLMVDTVRIDNVRIVEEAHKRAASVAGVGA